MMSAGGRPEPSEGGRVAEGRARLQGRVFPVLRWVLPGVLLGGELMVLSLLVDLPTGGPSTRLAEAVRVAFPVLAGAAAAGSLMGKRSGRPRAVARSRLPGWRPFPALAVQPVAFALTAVLGYHLLGPARPPVSGAAFLAWLGCTVAIAVLALASAVPLGWAAREAFTSWRAPLVAVALGAAVWRAALGTESLWDGALSLAVLRATAAVLRLGGGEVAVVRRI